MKLWKIDTEKWTVRQVTGEMWPGKDEDGEPCFENTHFDNESDAWRALLAEAQAGVELSARLVIIARKDLAKANQDAAQAVVNYKTAQDNHRKHKNESPV